MKTTIVAALLAVTAAAFVPAPASTASTVLSTATLEHLKTAMRGEAFAAAKYQLYADHARAQGNTELADLFERTGKMERAEHFAEEAALAQLVNDDAANLKDAIAGESYEVGTMYREFADQAHAAGDDAAGFRFDEVRRDEMRHLDAFKAALARLDAASGH